MRIGMIVLTSILLSGCATSKTVISPCGANDYIDIPKGGVIQNVDLPTDEDKNYNVITPKVGFWMSLECHNRMDKGK